MKDYVRLLRPLNCLMTSLAVLIGSYVAGHGLDYPLSLAMVSAFLICGGGMVINDYYDRELDFIFTPEKPIPSGRVTLRGALIFSSLLFVLGIYLSFWVNLHVFAVAAINSLVLYLYARVLQRKFLLSNLTVSFLVGSSFVYGGLVSGNYMAALFLGLIAFFSNTSREIVKDIEDRYEDTKGNINSMPVVLGNEESKRFSSVFLLVAIILSPLPYVLDILNFNYMLAVLPSLLVFGYTLKLLGSEESSPGRIQLFLKIGMLLGLLAFLVGGI